MSIYCGDCCDDVVLSMCDSDYGYNGMRDGRKEQQQRNGDSIGLRPEWSMLKDVSDGW